MTLTTNKAYSFPIKQLSFGNGITCLPEDDLHWLAEVHSRNTLADYKLVTSSLFESFCKGKEHMVYSWQIPRQLWHSLAYNIPKPSMAVLWSFLLSGTSELAVQTLAQVSEWAEGTLSGWEKCWLSPVLQFFRDCLKFETYLRKTKSNLQVVCVHVHLDWNWMEQECPNYRQTPIMTKYFIRNDDAAA